MIRVSPVGGVVRPGRDPHIKGNFSKSSSSTLNYTRNYPVPSHQSIYFNQYMSIYFLFTHCVILITFKRNPLFYKNQKAN